MVYLSYRIYWLDSPYQASSHICIKKRTTQNLLVGQYGPNVISKVCTNTNQQSECPDVERECLSESINRLNYTLCESKGITLA